MIFSSVPKSGKAFRRWPCSFLFLAAAIAFVATPLTAASPALTVIAPATVTQGNQGFTITVTGSNFIAGDSITANDSPIPTTYVGPNMLTGVMPARFLTFAGQLPIGVRDPADNASNQILLTIVPPPAISVVNPQAVDAASTGFTLSVVGTRFLPGSTVRLGSAALTTTYISANQLSAVVPASLLVNSGRFDLTVVAPDGPASSPGVLIVSPILSSVGNAQINGNQVTVEANGVGFVAANSVVLTANGIQISMPTTFVSPTRLRATVPQNALIAGGGQFNIQAPDGANSRFLSYSFPFAVTSFAPGGAIAGGPAFTLLLSGGIFPPGTLVVWAGTPLTTTVTSPSQLAVSVPASLITAPGVVTLLVQHPNGNRLSLPFATNSGSTISSIAPNTAPAGGPGFTLTVNGGGFQPGAAVYWKGAPLPTTFVNTTQLTATVAASLVANPGSVVVHVVNPGNVLSNTALFLISLPFGAPSILSLTPGAAIAGGGNVVLTVNGTAFTADSTVLFNGTAISGTTFVSNTQLVATIPASLIAAPGTATIAVRNSTAISSALAFNILAGPPVTSGAAIVNLGNPQSGIAPGSLISIYGSGLSGAAAAASFTPLPASLSNVTVTVNGLIAPLLYVSPSQINAQVPFEAPAGLASVVVSVGGVAGVPAVFPLSAIDPGVWTMPGTSRTLAVSAADGSIGMPVAPGTYVTVYLTGQGALSSPIPTGGPAPANPLVVPAAAVEATVGGVAASDIATAMAPGLVGVLQVNLQVPPVAAGDQPLVIKVGGVASNTSFLPIAAF